MSIFVRKLLQEEHRKLMTVKLNCQFDWFGGHPGDWWNTPLVVSG